MTLRQFVQQERSPVTLCLLRMFLLVSVGLTARFGEVSKLKDGV